MKHLIGIATIWIRRTALLVREERQGQFFVFNPTANTGTVFNAIDVLLILEMADGKDVTQSERYSAIKRRLMGLGVTIPTEK